MSFLDQLKSQRSKLKSTETTITFADGSKVKVSTSGEIRIESNSYGFVEDTSPDHELACIIDDFLYLGSQDAVSTDNIEQNKVTDVLSIGVQADRSFVESKTADRVQWHFVNCLDLPESNLRLPIDKCVRQLESIRTRNGRVIVHCNAGVSRAPSICIGYLTLTRQMTFETAFDLVKSKRTKIQPNRGFLQQLKEF